MTLDENADHDVEVRIYHATPDDLDDEEPVDTVGADWPVLGRLTDIGLRRKIVAAFEAEGQHAGPITLEIEDGESIKPVREAWRPTTDQDEELCKHLLSLGATNAVSQWRQEGTYE